MAKTVQLTLTGLQRDETGRETVAEFSATAEYYLRNGSHYIFYEETMEDTGLVTKNTVKLKESVPVVSDDATKSKEAVLELTKKGAVNTRMIFEAGREYMADYSTPYGCLQLGILTRTVEVRFEGGLPRIRAEYSLTSEGRFVSDCIISIKLQRRTKL